MKKSMPYYITCFIGVINMLLSIQIVQGQTFPDPYCNVYFPSGREAITKVEFANISHSSSEIFNGSPALENFLHIEGFVERGKSYPISLHGNTEGEYTCHFTVFIDWNQDGDFNDVNESSYIGSIYNSTGLDEEKSTGTINVPANALLGKTRLRVIKRYATSAGSCNSSGYGQAEDYTLNVVADENSGCFSVSGLKATEITRATATISWDTPDEAPEEGYEYYLSTISGIPDITATPTGQSSTASIELSTLKAGQTYYVWVRAKCSDDSYSSWRPVQFTTTMPWTEKFVADYHMPSNWRVLSGYWDVYAPAALPDGDGNVITRYFWYNESGAFATSNIPNVESGDVLQFNYRLGYYAPPFDPPAVGSGNFVVSVSTDGGNNFTEIATVPNNGLSGWQLFSHDLSDYAGQTIQISITVNTNTGDYYIGFDNFYAGPPICNRVLNLQSAAIGTTTATISWNAPTGGSTEYAYYLSENNSAPNLTTAPTGTINQTTLELHSLSPGQQYYLWVRSVCGPEDFSEWSAIYTFATEYEENRPWAEDFATTVTPKGWGIRAWQINENSGIPYADGYALHAVLQNSTLDLSKSFTTPIIKGIEAGDRLSFKYAIKDHVAFGNLARGEFKVAISTDNGAHYSNVSTVFTYSDSPWEAFSYDLTPYAGQDIKIRIIASHYIGGYQLGFDSFRIAPAPSCLEVSAIQVENITFTEAKINWLPVTGSYYEYFLSNTITGLQEYSGTFESQTDTEIQFDNLQEGTTYYFWVRNRCDTDESSQWSSLISFTTLQSTSVPWNEQFSTASKPTGWLTDEWIVDDPSTFADRDGAAIYQNIYYPSNFNFSTLYIRDIKAGDVLSFMYQHIDYYDPYGPPGHGSGHFVVAVSTDMGQHYTDISTVANNDIAGWQTFSYLLDEFAGETIRIRITASYTSGDYYLGFDNFSIQSRGTCPLVQNIRPTDLTSNRPVISWDALPTAPTGGYDYYYSSISLTPDAIGEPSGNTADSFVTLPSLSSGKRHYIYVRANCGDDNYGAWSNALAFDLPLAHDENNIVYVRENGTGNGSSWDNAVADLQAAIDLAGVKEVWVAEGTYYAPTTTSFKMKNNVVIYGGFSALGSPIMDERNWKTYPTILSGAQERRVVNNNFEEEDPLQNTAIIDGFFIQDGKAVGNLTRARGAGVYNYNASPIMRNLHIRNNVSWHGAGICNESSSPSISDVMITHNHIEDNDYLFGGAALTNLYASNVTITRAVIENNTGDTRYGAGIFNDYSENITISESIIRNNILKESVPPEGSFGGGIFNMGSSVLIKNTVITGNAADMGAGISSSSGGEIVLLNVTIAGNTGEDATAISNDDDCSLNVMNSIIYSNGNGLYDNVYNTGTSIFKNSIIKRPSPFFGNWNPFWGTNGGNNLLVDPLFTDAANGDYSLRPNSPAINVGSNNLYTTAGGSLVNDLDVAKNSRLFASAIDIGAYEYHCQASYLDQTTFTDKEVVYSGTAQSIIADNIPVGITVRYEIIDVSDQVISEAIHAGTYTVKAIFSGCGPDIEKTAQLNIKKADLVITANNQNKTYGDTFTFEGTEFSAQGLVNGNAVTSVTLTSLGAPATAVVDDYDILVSDATGTGLGNYTITYIKGKLTVDRKTLTITANDQTKTYGETVTFDGTEFSAQGLVNGDAVTSVTLISLGAPATAIVDDYDILVSNATGTGLDNYNITYEKGILTVNSKPLTITANNQTKTYGDTFTFEGTEFSAQGLVNGDAVTAVTLTSAGAPATAVVDDYDILVSDATGTGLGNYTINYTTGTLTVNSKPLTITANDQTKTYGDTFTFSGTEFSAQGLVNDDAVTAVTLTSAGAPATAVVDDYDILVSDATGAGLDNYTISYVKGTLTVNSKMLTIMANDRTKAYGETVTFDGTEFSTQGLVNGDAVTSVTLTSAGAPATAVVDDYDILASDATGTGLDNYTISYVKGTLTVNSKPLTITANNRTKIYGEIVTFDGTEFSTQGLVNGDTVTAVTLTSVGTSAMAVVDDYDILVSDATGTGLDNYNITYEKGTLTANSKPLTITANDQTKTYGQTVTFNGTEFAAQGLINGDAVTSVTLTSTGAPATAVVDDYDILASDATGTGLDNYTITYERGTLTVNSKPLTITANNQTKTYGDTFTFEGTEFSAQGLVNGDAVTSVTLTSAGTPATAVVDDYDILVSDATGTGLGNYTINYTTGTLTVNSKPLTITANDQTKTYGDTFTFNGTEFAVNGLVNGDAVTSVTLISLGAPATAVVDDYDILASDATGTGLDNYTITYIKGTLTVNSKPLTITANDQTKTYGDTFTFSGTEFSAQGLVNDDAVTAVTLTSAGAPATAVVDDYDILVSDATGAGLDNYTISYVKGTLTVGKKALTITANNRTKIYGETVTFDGTEFSTQGLVNGDAVTAVILTSVGTPAMAVVDDYEILVSDAIGTGLDNYTITYIKGMLTVNRKTLTITANDQTKTYGETATFNGMEFSAQGLVNNDAVTSVTLTSEGEPATAVVDDYDILVSDATGTGLGNYTITYIKGTLTVDSKPLTITANDQTKTYGQTVTFNGTEFAAQGLINGDAVTSVTLTSTGALATAIVDEYDILVSNATGTGLGNYTITYEKGTLTVNKATISGITFPDKTFIYDGTTKSIEINGELPQGVTVNYTGNDKINAGTYTVTAEIAETANHIGLHLQAELTIQQAPQTITFISPGILGRDAGTVILNVESSSGLPVQLAIDDEMIATVNSESLSMVVKRLGTVTVTATQSGNENYLPADPVSMTIRIANDANAPLPIRVHQAVSPNNDGINDFLMIEGIRDYPENKVTIFDKSGKVLAEVDNYDNRDRVFTGQYVNDGTYYYYLDIRDSGQWKREKGFFVVKRTVN